MNIGLNAGASEQLDELVGRLDRLTAALEANTKAIEQQNRSNDYGPRR